MIRVLQTHLQTQAEICGYLHARYDLATTIIDQQYLRELLTRARMIQGTLEGIYYEQENKRKKK